MKFPVGVKTFVAKAGAFVLVPKGTPHTFTRVEQKPAKFLVVYSPAGFEKFFDEAVDLDVTDTETYVAKAGRWQKNTTCKSSAHRSRDKQPSVKLLLHKLGRPVGDDFQFT